MKWGSIRGMFMDELPKLSYYLCRAWIFGRPFWEDSESRTLGLRPVQGARARFGGPMVFDP